MHAYVSPLGRKRSVHFSAKVDRHVYVRMRTANAGQLHQAGIAAGANASQDHAHVSLQSPIQMLRLYAALGSYLPEVVPPSTGS